MGGRQDNTKFGHQEAYEMYTKLEEHYLKRCESAHEGVRDYCETMASACPTASPPCSLRAPRAC